METKFGVIGGGSWATAIAKMLSNNSNNVNWWIRHEESVAYLKKYKHNDRYLQSVEFDLNKVHPSADLAQVVRDSDVLVIAIPSAYVFKVFDGFKVEGIENKILFSAIKGIVPEYHSIPARFFHKEFNIPYDRIGIISGPCHAEEIALERLSYLTIACPNQEIAEDFATAVECRYVKASTSEDIFGTELSAIMKNIMAIASGIYTGLGYGDNFQAVLISNAIQEIERFVDKVSPVHRDTKSSAYLGDLLVTAYSNFSRNRTFGMMIGKGYSVKAAQLEMSMVAEGYFAVKSIVEMNKKFEVDLPITQAVYNIIYEKISPVIEMNLLKDKLS
ncbi:MAG: NAD(P)H-dependent glycerol-3-phosphate dehydrogenase [Salibacteraceae bacterium]|jgi:glycerol-3-phosphate dehydrogenase (NAD(P)+)|nr:NAD(P)H-dependent glycerol-3-phosphate dehydrogenase [Salibacteraceae bacterium]MDP4687051.1 NAD(P)H-dependent glycerol-3-phosphate dehydrogenase [Salibacteraceae bacterium]MDP4763042.1 NAD(P)H-dependent glycerol-3-phosphate dehydrogenase [Salibacteraceae bacterium]MDP4845078.1 NAD(P)H-dependent glycerol-3-phosphate dehydrogenase [Salibacteraceae bacterium]MDP4963520.1 NAD(P)H-dependent glycerol-3-phosphate dehydrogenase [Salibacteraceae bacterium]